MAGKRHHASLSERKNTKYFYKLKFRKYFPFLLFKHM